MAVLADTQLLAVQPDVVRSDHVTPGVRYCGVGRCIPEVVGGNCAFDLVAFHVRWFDVDQAYLVLGIL